MKKLIFIFLFIFSTFLLAEKSKDPIQKTEISKNPIAKLMVSNNGKYLVSAPDGKGVHALWDRETGKILQILDNKNILKYVVTFSPDNQYIAWDSDKIYLYDIEKKKVIKTFAGHGTKRVYSIVFCPQRRIIASGGCDRNVKIWDMDSGNLLKTIPTQNECIAGLDFSSDGERMVYASSENEFSVIDMNTYTTLLGPISISDTPIIIQQLTFSRDNQLILSCEYGAIKIWDSETGEKVREINPDKVKGWYQPKFTKFSLSFNNKWFAAIDETRRVYVYDMRSGKKIDSWLTDAWHSSVYAITFLPDNKTVATAGDGYIKGEGNRIFFWEIE